MPSRPFILHEATYKQLKEYAPRVALLPWGATEAHNFHLPHGTDTIEATTLAERAGQIAHDAGARVVVLPTIPFGNDAQQLDQVATISCSATTSSAILDDVASSLSRQNIDRLVVLNAHGGNEFKSMVRDLQAASGMLVVVINFWQMCPDEVAKIFDNPGDHAGDLETSFLLATCPQWVELAQAGPGKRMPFEVKGLSQPGVWTPRPWSQSHPDTGAGDPRGATAEKGERFIDVVSRAIAQVLTGLDHAKKGELPYL